ncbi:hypothetical protein BDR06DRAFT_1014039 [Suillus hirtellus]|nr:hypothetical protein BDR06DRAFT_1014039 [Suillus hirtellus]
MTIVLDDPAWWPIVNAHRTLSYFIVAAFVGMTYDWALTFGQEVELIWRQRWSLMTVLYLAVRYLGISYTAMYMLGNVPTILLSDTVSLVHNCHSSLTNRDALCKSVVLPEAGHSLDLTGLISYMVSDWTVNVAYAMLWVIIITRLYAMYQRSRKILIFLIVTFLAVSILDGVTIVISTMQFSGEEFILSGTYLCQIDYAKDIVLLVSATWILSTAWEVVALCLAVWIAVQHFRELRQHSAGGIVRDCFTVLIKTHVVHFASFVAVSCFTLVLEFTPIFSMVYHAKLVADADAATVMTSIAFQERVHISTGSGV